MGKVCKECGGATCRDEYVKDGQVIKSENACINCGAPCEVTEQEEAPVVGETPKPSYECIEAERKHWIIKFEQMFDENKRLRDGAAKAISNLKNLDAGMLRLIEWDTESEEEQLLAQTVRDDIAVIQALLEGGE